jgi:hypothetical protein
VSQSSDPRVPAENQFEHHVELDLQARPLTAADARRAVRKHLTTWDVVPATIDMVLLLTSEVVTNASRHAPPPLHLVLRHGAPGVRVEVTDSYAAGPTRRPNRSPQRLDEHRSIERCNRTLATEWAYRQVFTSNDQRAAALAPWLEHYNTQRRHAALGGLPPISRLSPT